MANSMLMYKNGRVVYDLKQLLQLQGRRLTSSDVAVSFIDANQKYAGDKTHLYSIWQSSVLSIIHCKRNFIMWSVLDFLVLQDAITSALQRTVQRILECRTIRVCRACHATWPAAAVPVSFSLHFRELHNIIKFCTTVLCRFMLRRRLATQVKDGDDKSKASIAKTLGHCKSTWPAWLWNPATDGLWDTGLGLADWQKSLNCLQDRTIILFAAASHDEEAYGGVPGSWTRASLWTTVLGRELRRQKPGPHLSNR